MDVILVLSLGFFYLSLAGIAGVVGYRIIRWGIKRRAQWAELRKKWFTRKEPLAEADAAATFFGSTKSLKEHVLFSRYFGEKKEQDTKQDIASIEAELRHEEEIYPFVVDNPMQDDEIIEDTRSEDIEESAGTEDSSREEAEEEQIREEAYEATSDTQIDDITPQSIITLLRRVDALIARKDFNEAKKILIRILSWQEDHFDASTHLAFVYLQSGEFRKAESLYRKAIQTKPRDASLLTNFALAILEQKDPMRIEDSVAAFQLATEIDSKNPERHANLGQSLFFSGDIPKAIAAFEKAIRLSPRNVEYQFFLADSYLAVRNFSGAKQAFEKILSISPTNPEATKEKQELERMGY